MGCPLGDRTITEQKNWYCQWAKWRKTAIWPDIAEGEVSMSIGLIALLDDIAAMAKVAAASLGDAMRPATPPKSAVPLIRIKSPGSVRARRSHGRPD
jgi:hypothetical protein